MNSRFRTRITCRSSGLLAAASAALLAGTAAHAAPVIYTNYIATGASDTSWVSPAGSTALAAINFGGDETSFGGVTWADGTDTAGGIVTGNDNVNGYKFRYGVYAVNWGANNSVFHPGGPALLDDGAWEDAANAPNSELEISGLTVGTHYAVQFVIADNRPEYVGRAVTVEAFENVTGNSTTVQYAYGDGRFVVVTADFTADATTVKFRPLTSGGGQINGVQLRGIPSFWSGTTDGNWANSDTTSSNFSSLSFDAAKTQSGGVVVFGDTDAAGNPVSTYNVTVGAGGASATTVSFENTTAHSYTFSSADSTGITGSTAITKTGNGTVTLSGANTYTGTTTINAGMLTLQDTYATPGFSIASSAILELDVASGTRDYGTATSFSGTGTLRKTGAGAAVWGASVATFAMGTGSLIDVQEGTLAIGSYANDSMSGNLADLNVAAGATFNSAACDASVNALTGAGTVILAYNNDYPRTMTVGVNDGGGTFSGALTDGPDGGNGDLVKTGTGTQTFSGANTYTGNTTVNGGTLVLADDAQLKFVVTDTNQNSVTGTGTVTFHGDFSIDTSAVSGTTGHIWQLVDLANLDPTSSFTSSFSVIGFSDPENDGIWTITDAKGDWSFDESTGELTLVIADNDYDIWGSAYGLSTGSEGGDLDNDGLTNGEEYAFGLIPNSGSSVNPILAPLSKTTGQFTYQRRDNGLTGLTYTIWYSTDLATWNEDAGATQPDGTPDGNGVETITVTLSSSLLTNPKLFVQVRAN